MYTSRVVFLAFTLFTLDSGAGSLSRRKKDLLSVNTFVEDSVF